MFRPLQRNLKGFLASQLPGPAVRVILGGDLCGEPPGAFAVKALVRAGGHGQVGAVVVWGL